MGEVVYLLQVIFYKITCIWKWRRIILPTLSQNHYSVVCTKCLWFLLLWLLMGWLFEYKMVSTKLCFTVFYVFRQRRLSSPGVFEACSSEDKLKRLLITYHPTLLQFRLFSTYPSCLLQKVRVKMKMRRWRWR